MKIRVSNSINCAIGVTNEDLDSDIHYISNGILKRWASYHRNFYALKGVLKKIKI